MRILIIEDERRLAGTLADILDDAGYYSDVSANGAEGLDLVKSGIYDAVILDVMLPGLGGYEVLQQLRAAGKTLPVLMLTARSALADRVRGLDAGADYYLTKPFENEELLACLRTILRRPAPIASEHLTFGDLTLTPARSELQCHDNIVTLSARELELIRLMIHNNTQFLPKETLLLKVWGYDASVNANSVEAYISFLRKKLNLLGSAVHITVIRNIGYKLEVSS